MVHHDKQMEKSDRSISYMGLSNILTGALLLMLSIFLLLFLIVGWQPQVVVINSEPASSDTSLDTFLEEKLQLIENLEFNLIEQQEKLSAQQSILQKQEAILMHHLTIRSNIVQELLALFSESSLLLDIDDQTGAIRFSETIFFDSNRDVIKQNGRNYLNQFIPMYMSILLSESNRDYIAEIIIEGHSDDVGSYIYNLDLSQRRAIAVARYIIESDIPQFDHKNIIHEYLTANGRSSSQPIMINGIIDKQLSRRVEFKFRLKDDVLMKEMQQIFEGVEGS